MKLKQKKIPAFKTLSAEKCFWQENDSTDYVDWSAAKRVAFPDLKPSVKTISLRLPESLLNAIRVLANKEDVPYQSLMKILLAEGVRNAHKHHEK
ncbi:MAG: BrnA antitoxin family protein [Gammaproteobacteria bacterium]|nr:BrnA antitoxin family protein [Gammaproteobacteria bacterium]